MKKGKKKKSQWGGCLPKDNINLAVFLNNFESKLTEKMQDYITWEKIKEVHNCRMTGDEGKGYLIYLVWT